LEWMMVPGGLEKREMMISFLHTRHKPGSMWRRGTAAVVQRSALVHVGPHTRAEQLQHRAISTIGRQIGSSGVASRFTPSSSLRGVAVFWRRPSSVTTPRLCWHAVVRGWSGTSAAHARATAGEETDGRRATAAEDEVDDEDDDGEWDSDDEDDEEAAESAQPGAGQQKAQQARGGNTRRPRTQDAEWLPPRTLLSCLCDAHVVRVRVRVCVCHVACVRCVTDRRVLFVQTSTRNR
jgi:hypothetical protein